VYDADRKLLAGQNETIHGVLDEYLALVSVYKAIGGGWMVAEDKRLAAKTAAGGHAAPVQAQVSTTTADGKAK
jgi:hypothetical protein